MKTRVACERYRLNWLTDAANDVCSQRSDAARGSSLQPVTYEKAARLSALWHAGNPRVRGVERREGLEVIFIDCLIDPARSPCTRPHW